MDKSLDGNKAAVNPNSGLTVINIDTEKKELPVCQYVSAPKDENGDSIKNPTKVKGRLTISKNGQILYDSGKFFENVSGMTLRIRGNASAFFPKKPYKIKLQKDADLLFHDKKTSKSKEWLLLSEGNNIKLPLGFITNEILGISETPSFEYVDLVINGNYQGTYILCEPIKETLKKKISSSGYIFEFDAY